MKIRIATAIMLCLILSCLFAIAFTVQSAKASEVNSKYIPTGRNVKVNLNGVYLQFDYVIADGLLTAGTTDTYPGSPPPTPPPTPDIEFATATSTIPPSFLVVWDVKVTARFLGHVRVGIYYGDLGETPTGLWQTDVDTLGLFVPGDVNHDGKVNWIDLWLITKALGSSTGSPRWNPYCDVNGDGKINMQDLNIAFQNLGKTSDWTDITRNFDTAKKIIYGVTDHFSLFGVR